MNSPIRRILGLLCLYIFLEIYIFIKISFLIGFFFSILLIVASSIFGLSLANRTSRFRCCAGLSTPEKENLSGKKILLRLTKILSAYLLVIPGPLSSILGLVFIFPSTQKLLASCLGTRLEGSLFYTYICKSYYNTHFPFNKETHKKEKIIEGDFKEM